MKLCVLLILLYTTVDAIDENHLFASTNIVRFTEESVNASGLSFPPGAGIILTAGKFSFWLPDLFETVHYNPKKFFHTSLRHQIVTYPKYFTFELSACLPHLQQLIEKHAQHVFDAWTSYLPANMQFRHNQSLIEYINSRYVPRPLFTVYLQCTNDIPRNGAIAHANIDEILFYNKASDLMVENRFLNVFLHEVGHILLLAHSDFNVPYVKSIMHSSINASVEPYPHYYDIMTAREMYGSRTYAYPPSNILGYFMNYGPLTLWHPEDYYNSTLEILRTKQDIYMNVEMHYQLDTYPKYYTLLLDDCTKTLANKILHTIQESFDMWTYYLPRRMHFQFSFNETMYRRINREMPRPYYVTFIKCRKEDPTVDGDIRYKLYSHISDFVTTSIDEIVIQPYMDMVNSPLFKNVLAHAVGRLLLLNYSTTPNTIMHREVFKNTMLLNLDLTTIKNVQYLYPHINYVT